MAFCCMDRDRFASRRACITSPSTLPPRSLFLIGVSLIYGADRHAQHGRSMPCGSTDMGPESRMLMEAGAALLGIAFLVKAGMWPLGFWLPAAYSAATPPVAAIFAILTKVGVYILLRLSLLLFGSDAGNSAGFGQPILLYGGYADDRFRRDRRPCLAGHGQAGGLLRAGFLRHADGRDRARQWRRHRRRAVLSRQFDADDLRLLPPDRTGGTRPRRRRRRSGRHDGSLW